MAATAEVGTPAAVVEAPAAVEPSSGAEAGDALFAKALAELTDDGASPAPPAEEAPVVEAPKPAAEPVPSEAELSKAFAAYKHKTKTLKADREAFAKESAEKEARLAEREASIAKAEAEHSGRQERAKKTPLEALAQLGWSPEQLLKYIADNGTLPPEKLQELALEPVNKKLKELEEKTAAQEKADAERKAQEVRREQVQQANAYEIRVGEEIVDVAHAEASKYPIIKELLNDDPGHIHREVMKRVIDHYTKTKKPLAISDAMLQVEAQEKSIAARYRKVAADPGQNGAVEPANSGSIEPIPSAQSARRGVAQAKGDDDLSDDERWEKALSQARGQ